MAMNFGGCSSLKWPLDFECSLSGELDCCGGGELYHHWSQSTPKVEGLSRRNEAAVVCLLLLLMMRMKWRVKCFDY